MTTSPAPNLAEFDVSGQLTPEDAPELFGPRKSFMWGYWKKADGEICIAPNWPTEAVQRLDEGWTRLPRYGEFLLQQAGWNINREPYRLILANGGAHEFSPEQVVGHNWHKRPPYKGVRFPQVDTSQIAEAMCKFCRKTFSSYRSNDPAEAGMLVDANLARHESVAHRENSQNAGLARALKDGLLDPRNAAALPTADLSALVQQLADTQAGILALLSQREGPAAPTIRQASGGTKR